MRPVLAVTATALLALTACSTDEPESSPTEPPVTSNSAPAEPVVHALSDTVTVGGVTISDMEVSTEGCEFTDPPTRDAVKFQLVATVENGSGQEIAEVLWASDISFTDPEGMTVKTTDIVLGGPPCTSDLPSQFNQMTAGEKRRAAVTVEAPVGAQEMIYNTNLIEGAEPVRWDIADEVAGMEAVSPEDQSATSTREPADEAEPAGVVGMTGAPGHDTPKPLDKAVSHCGDPRSMESGTTFFTDGTTGWTQGCADVMYPQQVEMRGEDPAPQSSGDDYAGAFEPAGTPPAANYQGWHCDGPAYLCRDDNASGKTAGQ